MSKVYLNKDETFIVASSATIFGSNGNESIILLDNVYNVVINSSIDNVALPLDIQEYEFKQYGIAIIIAHNGNEVVTIQSPIQTVLFNSVEQKIKYNAGSMSIGSIELINNEWVNTTKTRVDLRQYTDGVANQSYVNACSSFSVITMIEIFLNKKLDKDYRFSQLFTYWGARTLDKYNEPIIDSGSTVGGNIWSVLKHGLCDLKDYPYIEGKVNDIPPAKILNSTKKVSMKYVYVNGTREIRSEKIREGLGKGYAVVFGLKITSDFYLLGDINKLEDMHYIGSLDGADSVGNHAMCIVGYDDNLNGGSFIVENSWGNTWGDKGFFACPYDVVDNDAHSVYSITRLELV